MAVMYEEIRAQLELTESKLESTESKLESTESRLDSAESKLDQCTAQADDYDHEMPSNTSSRAVDSRELEHQHEMMVHGRDRGIVRNRELEHGTTSAVDGMELGYQHEVMVRGRGREHMHEHLLGASWAVGGNEVGHQHGLRRRLTTVDVSTFAALSTAVQSSDATVNVMSNITFEETLTISGRTNLLITTTNGAVFTSSFTATTGGMFYVESAADLTITGLRFVSGSASINGGCMFVTGSAVTLENVEMTACSAGYVSGIRPSHAITRKV